MNPSRMIGIGLLAVGVVLLIMGLTASDSVADQVSDAVTGRYTDKTMWYIIGGIAAAVIGLVMTVTGVSKKA